MRPGGVNGCLGLAGGHLDRGLRERPYAAPTRLAEHGRRGREMSVSPHPASDRDASRPPPGALAPPTANLLNDLETLAGLLGGAAAAGSWLDAYLLSAGMVQVAEDWLHAVPGGIERAAPRLAARLPRPLAGLPAAGAAAARGLSRARRHTPGRRAVARWRQRAAGLADTLAAAVLGAPPAPGLADAAAEVAAGVARLPRAARRTLVRLPAAFHDFDQRPADLERLTGAFAALHPDRNLPLAVVGVRTSGSYTAPLHAAALRALGYTRVTVASHRPGEAWFAVEARSLRAVARGGGLALLSDDPPSTGGSLARSAQALERLGYPADRVLILAALPPGTDALPGLLGRHPAVLLRGQDWAVRRRLRTAAVERDLAILTSSPGQVRVRERLADPSGNRRGHLRSVYRVSFGGHERTVLAQGVGLGYLGWHAQAASVALAGRLPRFYGVRDGILYRDWLPEERRLGPLPPWEAAGVAGEVAAYVAERATALPLPEDVTRRLGRRGSAWKRAGDLLARGFGRAEEPVRPLLQIAARELLTPDRPAVVDGRASLGHWFRHGETLLKVDAGEGAFSNADLFCCDPTFDLAGAAAGEGPLFGRLLRAAHEQRSGRDVDPERWLLYQLVQLEERLPPAARATPGAGRELARLLQSYYAEVVFADTETPASGPLCGIDLDGVLETPGLGFPGLTPSAAVALRALARHGYRVILASGRSLREVRDRCFAYPLAGGVAEYGAAVYEAAGERAQSLLSSGQRAGLDRLRRVLAAEDGLQVDPAYRASVRTYRTGPDGRPRALPAAEIQALVAGAGLAGSLQVIQGAGQTDIVPVGVDKGRGLRVLAARLGQVGEPPLALAVGDSLPDLPLLAAARLALATGNADASLRAAGVRVLGRPCQLGFADAVAVLLGHPAGGCETCRLGNLPKRSRLLLAALAGPEQPGLRKLLATARVAVALRRLKAR